MDFTVAIDNFEGPMDLLLHLVKETKLDIYEIKMSEIIDNYLNYIHKLQELNIDTSSSFLLMASSLIHLKSRKLIGKIDEKLEEDDEYTISSEEELRRRIIEYEEYKEITKEFIKLKEKREEIFTKLPENLKNYQENYVLENNDGLDAIDLKKALENVLERLKYKEPKHTRITKKEISVADRKIWIRKKLEEKSVCDFEELFEVATKEYVIATFLAILIMSKEKAIVLDQDENDGKITIRRMS